MLAGCRAMNDSPAGANGEKPDHSRWTQILDQYVDTKGNVRYAAMAKDRKELDLYLQDLSEHPPARSWSKEERLAYWINAYNAYTVVLIVDHMPVESIKDITPNNIPFVSSPWDLKFFKLGGKKYDLNNIEHNILRKQFDEPRIHFAINCASFSCPRLRNEAFIAEKLEAQLSDQTRGFLSNTDKNKIRTDAAELSKIFSWFKGDFTRDGSLLDFINKYSAVKVNPTSIVSYLPYDWKLNDSNE